MGRYPLLTLANEYLDAVRNLYAEATVVELDRRLRRMAKDFRTLKQRGSVSTDDPRKMTEKEILSYLGLLRERGLKDNGQAHNVASLKSLLLFCGNPTMDRMKLKYGHVFPKKRTKRYPPLEQKDVDEIVEKAMQVNDWRRLLAYSMVILSLATGLRSKELRLANLKDLDAIGWRIRVTRPKGEGKYGMERTVPILPFARPILTRYLAKRAENVAKYAPSNDALFPALRDKRDGFYSSQQQRLLKKVVEEETGTRFELRACRRTFGQICIDKGAQVEAVSLMLGHSSTKTTESYYCRKREDVALREISQLWEVKNTPSAKKTFN